jgi:hypothetical protein
MVDSKTSFFVREFEVGCFSEEKRSKFFTSLAIGNVSGPRGR